MDSEYLLNKRGLLLEVMGARSLEEALSHREEALAHLPTRPGVFAVFYDGSPISRSRGESDIVHIGWTGSLRRRFEWYFAKSGPTARRHRTTDRGPASGGD